MAQIRSLTHVYLPSRLAGRTSDCPADWLGNQKRAAGLPVDRPTQPTGWTIKRAAGPPVGRPTPWHRFATVTHVYLPSRLAGRTSDCPADWLGNQRGGWPTCRQANSLASIRYSDTARCNFGRCSSAPGVHPKCHASRLVRLCARGSISFSPCSCVGDGTLQFQTQRNARRLISACAQGNLRKGRAR